MKGLGFRAVTIIISLLIIGGFIVGDLISAHFADQKNSAVADQEEESAGKPSPVTKVYVLDNSGLEAADYKQVNPQLSKGQYKDTQFITVTGQTRQDVIKTAQADSPEAIAVIVEKSGTGYHIEAVLPPGSTVTKKQADKLLDLVTSAFETNKMLQAGLTNEQLTAVFKPVVTNYSDIGENAIAKVIKMAAPMVFGFMLYFMLLLYGQDVSKSVSTEKTSKLMEMLLTSVHPYALITGKVLAVTSMALLQFVTWIVSLFIGLYGGNAIAHAVYPDYQNSVVTIINFLKDNIGATALTLPAVILAIICFCVGFLFYCVLAGIAGCLVSKPEDAAQTQSIFVYPVLISFLVCYMAPLAGKEDIMKVVRYIPFTAPFSVPVDLMTGVIGLPEGIMQIALLVLFTGLVIMLSGRIYKGMILYTGQKPSFKTVLNVMKANK